MIYIRIEFALATVNTKRLITHDRLRIAFDMFDKVNDVLYIM